MTRGLRADPLARPLQRATAGALVWDNHACLPMRPGDDRFLPELARCWDAGIDLVTLAVGFDGYGVEQHIRVLAHFRDWLARHAERYSLVRTTAEAREAKAQGKLGVCFDIEGMNALGGQADLVPLYYDLGVRWMLIAYNRANGAGGGCLDEADEGLSAFGRKVIAEMNRVGMVLCCSHAGYRTARQAIDASAHPVIFSHSNPRAVWDHPRNIPDDLMRACAARGGVIGLNGIGQFLGADGGLTDAFVRHLEHALDVVGEDHIGIGLDHAFDPLEIDELQANHPAHFPREILPCGEDERSRTIEPWRLPEVARALEARGHRPTMLAKLFGENLMRIAEQVWR